MTVHLEGLGVVGCYLALRLFMDGEDFTWHDTDEPVTAWRACTGAIFPTGHADDLKALAVWRMHLDDDGFAPFLEEAAYVFCTQRPPHGGRYTYTPLTGNAKLAAESSLHLNAQTWVPWVREFFKTARRPSQPAGSQRVVTHGFGPRLARFMWGWTVPVRVRTVPLAGELRPAVYFRRGRFVMAYAYPIPRTDLWYAGSSLISQHVPKNLEVMPKYRRWRDTFLELGEGFVVGVVPAGPPAVGWRPVPAEGDHDWISREADGALAARPLWHSGVRHAPHIYNALQEVLHA